MEQRQRQAETKAKMEAALAEGMKLVIDLQFEGKMLEGEIKSLCQQLSYTYAANKAAVQPCHLMLLGATGGLKELIDRQVGEVPQVEASAAGLAAWAGLARCLSTLQSDCLSTLQSDCSAKDEKEWCSVSVLILAAELLPLSKAGLALLCCRSGATSRTCADSAPLPPSPLQVSGVANWYATRSEQPYIQHLAEQRQQLVYLTADSSTVLEEVDPAKIYIIGGGGGVGWGGQQQEHVCSMYAAASCSCMHADARVLP